MVRRQQRQKAERRRKRNEGKLQRCYLDQRKGILLQYRIDQDDEGNVISYALAYIDHTLMAEDSGRVLGYDNDHGYHHRHFWGEVEEIEFESFEALAERFEREYREIYDEYHANRHRKRR